MQTTEERAVIFDQWRSTRCPSHIDPDNITVVLSLAEAVQDIPDLKVKDVVQACAKLDLQGQLPHRQVQVVEVEKPTKKLSKADKLQQVGLNSAAEAHIRTEFDRLEKSKPKASPSALEAQATNDLRVNELMNDVIASIRGYRGAYHSQTARRQEELFATFEKFKDPVKTIADAEKMQRTIKKQIDAFEATPSRRGR